MSCQGESAYDNDDDNTRSRTLSLFLFGVLCADLFVFSVGVTGWSSMGRAASVGLAEAHRTGVIGASATDPACCG